MTERLDTPAVVAGGGREVHVRAVLLKWVHSHGLVDWGGDLTGGDLWTACYDLPKGAAGRAGGDTTTATGTGTAKLRLPNGREGDIIIVSLADRTGWTQITGRGEPPW